MRRCGQRRESRGREHREKLQACPVISIVPWSHWKKVGGNLSLMRFYLQAVHWRNRENRGERSV